jgi:hypothetical protein
MQVVNLAPQPFPSLAHRTPAGSFSAPPLFSWSYKSLLPTDRFRSPLFSWSYKSLFQQALCYDNDLSCRVYFSVLSVFRPTSCPLCCAFLPHLLYSQQLADSLTLLSLFFKAGAFVFNNLQPLFAKHRGYGVPGRSGMPTCRILLCASALQRYPLFCVLRSQAAPPNFRHSTVDCRLPLHNAKIHSAPLMSTFPS